MNWVIESHPYPVMIPNTQTDSKQPDALRLSRRRYVSALAGASVAALAGCSSDNDSNQSDGSRDTTTSTSMSESWETLHDTIIYSDNRWPHEFSAGDTLHVKMTIEEGGPGIFYIIGPDNDAAKRVEIEVSQEFTHEVQQDGRYYLQASPNGQAKVLVEVKNPKAK